MIFFFTATGNSMAAACALGKALNDKVADMRDYRDVEDLPYELSPGESIGFVFPCYYSGLPAFVTQFIQKLTITGADMEYVYAVITYGRTLGGAGNMLKNMLSNRNIPLNAVFSLKMPANCVMLYDTPGEEDVEKILAKADEDLKVIAERIRRRDYTGIVSATMKRYITSVKYPMYIRGRNTTKFSVNADCTGCGACAKNCPVGAITMKRGKPHWSVGKCCFCSGCINRCEACAIQYGRKTAKRRRYVNPILK